MRSPTRRAATVAFALVLATTSCAGTTDTVATSAAEPSGATAVETVVEAPPTTAPVQATPRDAAAGADSPPIEATQARETPVPPPLVEPEPAASEPAASEPAAVAAIVLPDVSVVDLATGQTADLAGFARPGPTLVWFWAPH